MHPNSVMHKIVFFRVARNSYPIYKKLESFHNGPSFSLETKNNCHPLTNGAMMEKSFLSLTLLTKQFPPPPLPFVLSTLLSESALQEKQDFPVLIWGNSSVSFFPKLKESSILQPCLRHILQTVFAFSEANVLYVSG